MGEHRVGAATAQERSVIITVTILVLCLSCMDQGPVQPRGRPVDVQVEQAIPDGCARFQIHANPGQTVTIDSIYGTQYCQTDELKLIQDSAAVFDAATGKLRVPIVVKNVGTRAVRGLLKLRYDADSVQLFDTNGNPVAGPTTIVGLGDSTLNNGRVAYWAYNQLLAPAGQLQVLFSGQTSGRRWLELQGTDWNRTVKIKLFTTAKYDTIPTLIPTRVPNYASDTAWLMLPPSGVGMRYVRDHLLVRFKSFSTPASRQAAIDQVGGAVVGGTGDATGVAGYYYVRLPPDPTQQRMYQAMNLLRANPAVLHVMRDVAVPLRGTHQRPSDGNGWQAVDWNLRGTNSIHSQWGLEALRAPLAWGCETGDSSLRAGVLDEGFVSLNTVPDLLANTADTSKVNIPGYGLMHGTQVASILGARGNNGQGVAGMTWRVALDLRDPTVLDSATGRPTFGRDSARYYREIERQFKEMVLRGDRVINISLGADSFPMFNAADTAQLGQAREIVSSLALWILNPGFSGQSSNAVVVVSAGNVPNGDPRESIFPLLKDTIPNRIVVVRGMTKTGHLLRTIGSNAGYVDFAAPGEGIGSLVQSGVDSLTGSRR